MSASDSEAYDALPEIANDGISHMTDAAFDEAFPKKGPCGMCGHKLEDGEKIDGRHRLLDMIVDRACGGDSIWVLSKDYDRPAEAIREVFRRAAWFRPGSTIRRKPCGRTCKVLRLNFHGPAKALVKDGSSAVWVYFTTLGRKWRRHG